jgi:CubicO group peptidase (beta-lactamase class C family)
MLDETFGFIKPRVIFLAAPKGELRHSRNARAMLYVCSTNRSQRWTMSLVKPILIIALLAGWTSFASAQEPEVSGHPEQLGFASPRLQRLTEAYQGSVDRGELPGAVMLIARGDKVAYFQAIGFQDREKKTEMKTDAIFRLASMTKPIVSVAVMTLVEDGKLDLDAPVSKYLPEFADLKVGVEKLDAENGKAFLALEPQKRPMIVQDLLRHTAGLVYGQFGNGLVHQAYREANVSDRNQTLAEFVTKLSKLPLAHQPGEVWEYSMAVDVLGRIVEVVSGKPLDQYIAERVTGPLHMDATDFYAHEGNLSRVAEPQNDPSGKRPPMPDVSKKPNFLSGGGGLTASASDYLKFAEMMLNGGEYHGARILAPHTVELMTSDALPPGVGYSERALTTTGDVAPTPAMGQGFGLGFAVRTAAGRNPLPGSVGNYYWTGAWGTTFWVDPAEKLIAIQMIQVPLSEGGAYRRVFRDLVYAAMTPSLE